ncbi:CHAT domain-containing protein [[Empedobacter] haloabium]|uniref:CHAT domain-containing protein n=1 Tax=[Empedobacter] haloabium TaxID=592317 RepID=A0ABZ1UPE4_9BURK
MPSILMVSASPNDENRLRLGAEFRDIRHAHQRARKREEWTIESNEAVTVDDLRRALLDHRPAIVHFSGHGGGTTGLCFEDRDGNTHLTDGESLAQLFHHFKDSLKCVVLNACYSEVQAQAISKEIDYVVGMTDAVEDESAAKFAVAFYDAIFAGTDFQAAFSLGCTALDLNGMPDSDVPIFMTGSHLAPRVLAYCAHVPEIERVLDAYFNTPFNDRASFTTTGPDLAPLLESFYRGKMHRTIKKVRVLSMKAVSHNQWCVEVSGANPHLMYIRIVDRSILVEWEASVGLWSIPQKTYLALGSHAPIVARVKAELSNYYNYEFADKKARYQSIQLQGAEYGPLLHAYVERHTQTYDELIKHLENGNEQDITVELQQVTDRTEMPLITRFLSPTWIYPIASAM